MGSTANFFGRTGQVLAYSAKWMIFIVRKYPLVGATYLVFFAWFFFMVFRASSGSSPVAQNPPPPPPVPDSLKPLSEPPPPIVVPVAQARVYTDGNKVIVRWNRPVQNQKLNANNLPLSADCQPSICTATLTTQAREIVVAWQEGSQTYIKEFRL